MRQFVSEVTDEEIKREKEKARRLRETQWWKRKRSSGQCYFCGRGFHPAALTMEHIVPLARGGKSVKGNIAVACKECNSKKKYLLPMEWEEYLEKMDSATGL